MYTPSHFREADPEALAAFIDAYPLAALIASGPAGMVANHMPVLRLVRPDGAIVLRGHVAKANDFWQTPADTPVLAIFTGPNRYISPAWYPSKAETGMVVPTWNYSVVHAHGRIQFETDAVWLREHVTALTDRHESTRSASWKVADAPNDYVEKMLRAIVGFEIVVERLEGKQKVSQNRSVRDREGVNRGLTAEGVADQVRTQLVRN